MPTGSASASTRCWGRRPREVREPPPARFLSLARYRRRAHVQVPPVVLRLLDARVQGVRARPRDAEDALAARALQPVEWRRRGLPGQPARMILASPISPIENVLRWLLVHLHDSVGLSWGWSIICLTIIGRVLLMALIG